MSQLRHPSNKPRVGRKGIPSPKPPVIEEALLKSLSSRWSKEEIFELFSCIERLSRILGKGGYEELSERVDTMGQVGKLKQMQFGAKRILQDEQLLEIPLFIGLFGCGVGIGVGLLLFGGPLAILGGGLLGVGGGVLLGGGFLGGLGGIDSLVSYEHDVHVLWLEVCKDILRLVEDNRYGGGVRLSREEQGMLERFKGEIAQGAAVQLYRMNQRTIQQEPWRKHRDAVEARRVSERLEREKAGLSQEVESFKEKMSQEVESFKEKMSQVAKENEDLKVENQSFKDQLSGVKKENEDLKADNQSLKEQGSKYEDELKEVREQGRKSEERAIQAEADRKALHETLKTFEENQKAFQQALRVSGECVQKAEQRANQAELDRKAFQQELRGYEERARKSDERAQKSDERAREADNERKKSNELLDRVFKKMDEFEQKNKALEKDNKEQGETIKSQAARLSALAASNKQLSEVLLDNAWRFGELGKIFEVSDEQEGASCKESKSVGKRSGELRGVSGAELNLLVKKAGVEKIKAVSTSTGCEVKREDLMEAREEKREAIAEKESEVEEEQEEKEEKEEKEAEWSDRTKRLG